MPRNDPTSEPNLFRDLFSYRPRETTTAEENYLTAALAYTLRRSPAAAGAWLRLVTNNRMEPQTIRWDTQSILESSGNLSSSIPDLQACGITTSGKAFKIICEHKWKARVSLSQLEKYSTAFGTAEIQYLVLVYAKDRDRPLAKQFNPPPGIIYASWKWEELFSALSAIDKPEPMLQDFLLFLREKGLSPGEPIMKSESVRCARDQADAEQQRLFGEKLMRYCRKLAYEFDWSCIPSFFENQYIRDSYGRYVFGRHGGNSGPHLTLGFYYDVVDHKLALLNPSEGIDLNIRLIARPNTNPSVEPVLSCLRAQIPRLNYRGATVHLRGDAGNGNKHTLFIARRLLSEIVTDDQTESQQIDRIYEQLNGWCSALFVNDAVLTILRTIKGHGGRRSR